ncbi:F-box/FBD/LRR-repeat protein [Glycine soja]|nr:F-box/FBD/LRR-repeat protein [Glycine soja]
MIMTRSKTQQMKEDRLSGLPDEILFIIMSFIMIKDAVKTCILSKRWRNLWKFLPNLTLHSNDFRSHSVFFEFVSRILSCSDQNHTLHSLDFHGPFYGKPIVMTNLMGYAVYHNIQHLNINVPYNISLSARVFSCPSLKSLRISVSHNVLKRTRIPSFTTVISTPKISSLAFDDPFWIVRGQKKENAETDMKRKD